MESQVCLLFSMSLNKKKNYFFNIGLPGRDGSPGLPGPKGYGNYSYNSY